MDISSDKKMSEVKTEFQNAFPGLKLEFYFYEHGSYEGSGAKSQVTEDLSLSEINPSIASGVINLDPQSSVIDAEMLFETKFGLHVQIFRRSNNIWLQTSTTDDWSLEKQNQKGLNSIQ